MARGGGTKSNKKGKKVKSPGQGIDKANRGGPKGGGSPRTPKAATAAQPIMGPVLPRVSTLEVGADIVDATCTPPPPSSGR